MGVYRPRKDSFLLKEVLEQQELDGRKVLDVGTGSGILAVAAASKRAEVTAVDINPEAVEKVRERVEEEGLEVEAFGSDLFAEVEESFDLIVFNPPYVPGEEEGLEGEEAWAGGEDGREVMDRFIEEAGNHLEPGGKVLLVQSSRNDVSRTLDRFGDEGLEAEVVAEEKLHFEKLVVVSAKSA